MFSALLLLLLVGAACITVGIFKQKAGLLVALGGSLLVYVIGWYVWMMLWWFQVVRLDELFAKMGFSRTGGAWALIALFAPPLLPVGIFNSLLIIIRRGRLKQFSSVVLVILTTLNAGAASGQSHAPRQRAKKASICGNPMVACKTTATFQPNDLPFRVPENSVIFDTELFYAIILKSVPADEGDCNVFVPEAERLQTQALFPDHRVFTSRCADVENLFYTNVNPKFRIMAVYGGTTLAEAKRVLEAVKATEKFPGANLRRMRTGFNGT